MAILSITDDLEWGPLSKGLNSEKKIIKFCVVSDYADKDTVVLLPDQAIPLADTHLYRNFRALPQIGDELICPPRIFTGLTASRIRIELIDQNLGDEGTCPATRTWSVEVCFELNDQEEETGFEFTECLGMTTTFQEVPGVFDADGKLVKNTADDLLGGFSIPVAIQRWRFRKRYPLFQIPDFVKLKNGAVNEDAIDIMGCDIPAGHARFIVDDIPFTNERDSVTGFEFHYVDYHVEVNPMSWATRIANAGYTEKKYLTCVATAVDAEKNETTLRGAECAGLALGDTTADGTITKLSFEEVPPAVLSANGDTWPMIPNPDVVKVAKVNINDESRENITAPQLLDKYGRYVGPDAPFRLLGFEGVPGNVTAITPISFVVAGVTVNVGWILSLTFDDPQFNTLDENFIGADITITCRDTSAALPAPAPNPYKITVPIVAVPGSGNQVTILGNAPQIRDFMAAVTVGGTGPLAADFECDFVIESLGAMLLCWKYPRVSFDDIDTCPEPVTCPTGMGNTGAWDRTFYPALEPTSSGLNIALQFTNGVAYFRSVESAGELYWRLSSFVEGETK